MNKEQHQVEVSKFLKQREIQKEINELDSILHELQNDLYSAEVQFKKAKLKYDAFKELFERKNNELSQKS